MLASMSVEQVLKVTLFKQKQESQFRSRVGKSKVSKGNIIIFSPNWGIFGPVFSLTCSYALPYLLLSQDH